MCNSTTLSTTLRDATRLLSSSEGKWDGRKVFKFFLEIMDIVSSGPNMERTVLIVISAQFTQRYNFVGTLGCVLSQKCWNMDIYWRRKTQIIMSCDAAFLPNHDDNHVIIMWLFLLIIVYQPNSNMQLSIIICTLYTYTLYTSVHTIHYTPVYKTYRFFIEP